MDIKDYFRTMFENKLLVKMPEKEDDHLTPATKLMEKKREMNEVENALAAEKEEFQMKMESLAQRRMELEKKELQLKESVIKFDKFLKENDAKLQRAVKKAEDERELQKSKQKDIERLQIEIKLLSQLKDKLHKKVQKNHKFNRYLEQSVEALDEFQEIREIIDRYETLTTNYKDLLDIEKENQERVNSKRKELNEYLEKKNFEILSMNNDLAELQAKLDHCQNESHKAENEWNHIQTTAAGKTLLIGETRMAIRNLYHLVLSHYGKINEKLEDVDTDHQLKKVEEFVIDLTKITNELSREGIAYYSPGCYLHGFFDKVSHQKLLLKLKSYGIVDEIFEWIKSFLLGRKQRVVLGNTVSNWEPVTSGVPKGSVLDPILFVLYINDLLGSIQSVSLSCAADLKLCGKVKSKLERSHELQKDLDVLYEWSRVWSTELNLSKCKVMYICGNIVKNEYRIGSHTLKETTEERRLNFLNLQNLEERRVRGDLIQMYKLINGLKKVKLVNGINYARGLAVNLRRPNNKRLVREINRRSSSRYNFITNRIVNTWNNLAESTILKL
ncbi:unnamed protein product [Brachionus calyciflorus]|uniref:DUF4200 domain-containing protein n=1 Tax=Brachionus calyciflorus TaxID=104777 RepID=A0A813R942_9BILA|nr:unnamed protein product [Brachionus calyciflorus]